MNDYQNVIALSRYSRWLEDEQRRETWDEVVNRFVNYVADDLRDEDYDATLLEHAVSLFDPLQFDTTCDRSVQGTMRVARQDLDAYLMRVPDVMDLPIYTTCVRLNQRPVSVKGMKETDFLWPEMEMNKFIRDVIKKQ